MEQIFIMFHSGPPLLDNFVGQKGGAMTNFAGGATKNDGCYCSLFLNCCKLAHKTAQTFKGGATRIIFMRM